MNIKFKAGDKVRTFTDDTIDVSFGSVYTVIGCDSDDVEFIDDKGDYRYRPPSKYELVSSTLTLESGKTYRTRDGRKVGPIHRNGFPSFYKFYGTFEGGGPSAWGDDGSFFEGEVLHRLDLVSEWDAPEAHSGHFKVGDRVVCVDSGYDRGRVSGLTGTVLTPSIGGTGAEIRWDGLTSGYGPNHDNWHVADRFLRHSPAEAPRPGSFIVVNVKAGRLRAEASPFIHPNRAAAEAEAKRLAEMVRGDDFRVYAFDHLSTASAAPLIAPAATLERIA
jgi:hypothetical protein